MNMKNTRTASAKGFTLVELIVVIVILAILATIAFLSFSSQSSSARDSKRSTDLSSISSKINVAAAQGTSIIATVADSSKSLTAGYLAGYALNGSTTPGADKYKAGKLNYVGIGIKGDDFKDPLTGDDYLIGATTLVGGSFHLAASVENDKDGNPNKQAILNGNYAPRTIANQAVVNSASGKLTVDTTVVGYFRVGDKINIGGETPATPCEIKSISSDKTTITLSGTTCKNELSIGNTGAILLGTTNKKEVASLIGSKDGNTTAVGDANLPY